MDTCAYTHTGKAAGYGEKKMSLTRPEKAQDQEGGWWVHSVDTGGNCKVDEFGRGKRRLRRIPKDCDI